MQFASFKWIHYEINTLISYYDEIAFENSLMLNQTGILINILLVCKALILIYFKGNVQLSSMIHILKSLTQNAKNIFLTMVEYVLNPDNTKKCKIIIYLLNINFD